VSRHPLRRSTVRRLLPVLGLLALTACHFGLPEPATDQGEDIAGLYELMFWIAIGVGSIVLGLILYSVIRFRRRNDDLPKQTRYHLPLEITYTVIPVLIVAFIFAATYRVERRVDRVEPDPPVTVDATAFQWQWRFTYPGLGIDIIGSPTSIPEFVVPVGERVRINLRAQDVIHAFFVPQFLFKRDTIPGRLNRFEITIPRAGTFQGECAEFCGLNHAEMGFRVKAVSRAEFDDWVREQQASRSPTPGPTISPAASPPTIGSPSPAASPPTGASPTPIASAAT
jgi:cytochrome c oxidase subunit 2